MSDDYDDYDEDEGEGQGRQERSNSEWAQLRKERKERAAAEERAAAAERRLAFIEAGLDPSDPRASYFVKGYDGDLSVDAIKAAAIEGGFIQAQQQQAAPEDQAAALAASQRIAAASAGGEPDYPGGSETLDAAYLEGGADAVLLEAERLGITVVRGQ